MAHNMFFILALCLLFSCGCGQPEPTEATPQVQTEPLLAKPAEQGEKSAVVRIVFVGQKQACDCTRERIEKSWKVLQEVLQGWKGIAVERIQLDVDGERCAELNRLKPLMVPPGIYFFDSGGALVHVLQGEVEEYQILEVLQR